MAKMTKTALKELAVKLARTQPTMTVEQLDAMQYDGRRAEAARLAVAAVGTAKAAGLRDDFENDVRAFGEAFVDHLLDAWGRQIKERDGRRAAWKRAGTGLTAEQASAKIVALLESMRIRGAKVEGSCGVRVEVERAWAVGGTLYVGMDRNYAARIVNPDNDRQAAGEYKLKTELSWSGTSRSLADSIASVAVYTELIQAAAEVEAVMSHERVVWTFGLDDPEPLKADGLTGAADPRQSETVQS